MQNNVEKLIKRATLGDGVVTAIIFALLMGVLLWLLSKFLFTPEALTMPLGLAVGMSIAGAIYESTLSTTRTFGIWGSLGEALGCTLGLLFACTGPALDFFVGFAILAACSHIGHSLRVRRLKKRGYTLASE